MTLHRPLVGRSRSQALLQAIAPTLRSTSALSTAATAALGLVPGIVTVARGGDDLAAATLFAMLVGGSALAWATEDAMPVVLATAPLGNAVRLMLRVMVTATVVALVLAAGAAAGEMGPGLHGSVGDRLPEFATAASVATAISAMAARRGDPRPAIAGIVGSLLAVAMVATAATRWSELPSFDAGAHHVRWWWLALAAAVVIFRAGRDPGRR